MTDPRETLAEAFRNSYTIERELGGGGMARVYLATERKFQRRVVLKVPAIAADPETLQKRFANEVMLAARLQQANIVPVLSAGVAGGLPFFTMPYVAGDSLRTRLASGPVPVPEAIGILRDVARALAYAHDAGVVHRDIKPENILLSSGTAVVTDFGIAKALTALEGPAAGAGDMLTRTGTSIGTPAYMAPEQAAADPATDARADLYAWGVVAWELLAGRHPFASATTPQALLAAHLTERPAALGAVRADVPKPLADLVARCLEKDPAARPARATELLAVIESLGVAGIPAAATRPPWRASPRTIALVVLAVLAWGGISIWRDERARTPTTAPAPATGALAVLPFEDLSPDGSDAYLGDGVAETLINALARVPGINVSGRTSAFSLRSERGDLRAIGEKLHVSTVLTGSVQRAGDQLRIAARLVRIDPDSILWSWTFDRPASQIFAVQDEVATAVTKALRLTLATGQPGAAAGGTRNPEAYDAYLLGRYHWNLRTTEGMQQATLAFQRAIALDSAYAQAWSGLADTYILSIPGEYNVPGLSPDSLLTLGIWAARRAVALAPQLGEAHASLAGALDASSRTDEALPEFDKGLALSPSYATGHQWFSYTLLGRGEWARGIAAMEAAHRLDPLAHVVTLSLAAAYDGADRLAEAEPLYAQGLAQSQQAYYAWRFRVAHDLARGDLVAASSALREAVEDSRYPGAADWRALHRAPVDKAAWLGVGRQAMRNGNLELGILLVRWLAGEDAVITELEALRGRRLGSAARAWGHYVFLGPGLRANPRAQAALRAIGFPPIVGDAPRSGTATTP